MTTLEAISKLKSIQATLLIASDKVAKSRSLGPTEKANAHTEYRKKVLALQMAIKMLES